MRLAPLPLGRFDVCMCVVSLEYMFACVFFFMILLYFGYKFVFGRLIFWHILWYAPGYATVKNVSCVYMCCAVWVYVLYACSFLYFWYILSIRLYLTS